VGHCSRVREAVRKPGVAKASRDLAICISDIRAGRRPRQTRGLRFFWVARIGKRQIMVMAVSGRGALVQFGICGCHA